MVSSVRLERKALDALDRLAAKRGTSVSDLIRGAVDAYLKRAKARRAGGL